MNKIIILFILLNTAWISSFAQQFQGGLAGGLIGSQVAGDTYSGFHKLGAYAGLWVKLDASQRSSFLLELNYSQKGSRHNPDSTHQDFTIYKMRLGYIEMPILYQFQLKNKIFAEIGPAFSFLLHSYEELNYMAVSYGKFKLFNPSFVAGIGYPVTEKLGVHFRMNSSLLSIRTNDLAGEVHRFVDHGQYNDCIMLFLSYKL